MEIKGWGCGVLQPMIAKVLRTDQQGKGASKIPTDAEEGRQLAKGYLLNHPKALEATEKEPLP